MKPGYKQTEVGVIPEDWDIVALDEIGIFSKGQGIKKDEASSGDIPCVRYGELYTHHNDIIHVFNSFISERVSKSSKKLTKGDILFAGSGETKGEIGKCAAYIGERNAFAGGDIVILNPQKGDSTFLGYLLNTPSVIKQKASKGQGDAIVHISAKALSSIQIPFPSLSEQRVIAAALSDVDALVKNLDKLIFKKRNIKQATVQQLLTGKTRLPGFEQEWEDRFVIELGEVVTGGTPRTDIAEYWGDEYPWITPTDICSGRDIYKSDRGLTQKGLDTIRFLPANSVLVTCIASIGKNCILKTPGACNQQINAIIPNKEHCGEFIYYIMEKGKQYLLANAGITATNIVSKKNFSELIFKIPFFSEQTAIAEVLSDIDAEIEVLEKKRSKTRLLKQGMMQELLTGKTRLI